MGLGPHPPLYLHSRGIEKERWFGTHIYYLDETWYNAGDCVRKLWVDTTVSSPRNAEGRQLTTGIPAPARKGRRLIITHVGSEDGFLPGALLCFDAEKNAGDYHSEMNGDTFLKWFKKFLPTLREDSVIVMDNAPYHSVQKDKFPTMSWNKNRIVEWLHGKGEIMQHDRYVKSKLIEIAQKYKPPGKNYVVHEYAKEKGHIVLRIPPNHCELNTIELAWAKIKGFIRKQNTTYRLADVRQLVGQAVESVSAENWQNFIRHAIGEETRFHEIDRAVDSVLDDHGEWVVTSDDSDIDV
ncbi:uncharacterized protein LOC143211131 [Lasioglossum baleicum]|uniref:uncharacterized protein LOC143211131 n=1 Tax=Lasioglossum baleicum TaxID=434251 RepID=UPI003FCE7083